MKSHIIYGPPGTGKTRTLVGIAASALKRGQSPVCYLSYTKSAAAEAVGRLKDVTGEIHASTIHSLAFGAMNLSRAQVVDWTKTQKFAEAIGVPFKRDSKEDSEPLEGDEYMAVLSMSRNTNSDLMQTYELMGAPGSRARFEMFVKAYHDWKRTYGYVDFDDMLAWLPNNEARVRKFRTILLDEAQDCSWLQWKAFESVAAFADEVYIAGDDDQSIFEWNGANPHGMDEFGNNNGAQVKILDQSYRVPETAWRMAMDVLGEIEFRVEKAFKHTNNKGSIIRYGDLFGVNWDAMNRCGAMVLVRDRFRSKAVQQILNSQLIPYTIIGGGSPYETKHADHIRTLVMLLDGQTVQAEKYQEVRKVGTKAFDEFDKHADVFDNSVRWIKKVSNARWWDLIDTIPDRLLPFYTTADLFARRSITLSTIHQAKGREHTRVIMDLELSTRALEQLDKNRDAECRVQYVGVTRTASELHLCGTNPIIDAAIDP